MRAADGVAAGIRLSGVVKRFGATRAVDGVTLDIAGGRFVTLLGPSGCGKTTLLRLIGALEAADAGTIEIAGREVDSYAPVERPTRMVFQSYALFPHMTVAQNVAYGLKIRGLSRPDIHARVAAQLATVGLAERSAALPRELSGGQQQRVALARALVTRPQVLLLDEPLAALDLKLRQRLQAELKAVQLASGITFVFVTHDQTEALALSDEVIVMERGQVVQRAPPAELYDRPATRYVAEFVGEATILPGRIMSRGNGLVRGDTAIGPVTAPERAGLDGDAVAVVIRPEGVRFTQAGAFPGVVTGTTYRGADMLAQVRIGEHILQASLGGAARHETRIGDAVGVEIAPGAVWLVPNHRPEEKETA